MATEIDLGDGNPPVRIGANIPHYRVATGELQMSHMQASLYHPIYSHHASVLYGEGAIAAEGPSEAPPNSDEELGRINMVAYRRLDSMSGRSFQETD